MRGDLIFVRATTALGIQLGVSLLHVHGQERCAGQICCIHNPSAHHMGEWPQNWRADRRQMERLCPHGHGHPDPDDLNPDTVHGCDGCCQQPSGRRGVTMSAALDTWAIDFAEAYIATAEESIAELGRPGE